MRAQKAIARKARLKLIAYESGQHLVGIQGGENNDQLTQLFHQANRHPRMGKLYRKYYDAWDTVGGELICAFSSVSQWSKWGSWGLMEFSDDRPADNPKFLATFQWASKHGQPVNVPGSKRKKRRTRSR